MSSNDNHDPNKTPSLDLELRIDEICDAFELRYQCNERPRIEDYLDETLGNVATQLAELVLVELDYRKKAGDTPRLNEYVSRFPSYSDVLKGLSDHFQIDTPGGYGSPPRIEHLDSFVFVGSGSFGVVWRAFDPRLRRFVAVKTPIRPLPTQSDRELFKREAQIAARLNHPCIVPVYSSGETDGRVYIIYEFVEGTTLRDRLSDSKPFTQKEVAGLCVQIAEALHHSHEAGVVHRDLKPANIMMDQFDRPHIMDFGLAKLLDTSSTIGVSGNPLGTPAYMSPEQAGLKSTGTDARSDIYSLGVILYELLAGKPVFQGNRDELMQKSQFEDPPAFSKHDVSVAPDLELICRKCLEKDKHDRYLTAADLSADLQRFLKGEPVKAGPVPLRVRLWRWLKKKRSGVLVTVAALAVSSPLLMLLIQPEPPPRPGFRRVHVITDPPGAMVSVLYCDPKTGEVDPLNRMDLIGTTPAKIDLLPGRCLVNITPSDSKLWGNLEVHRTVPGFAGEWPSMNSIWERSKPLAAGEIEWPAIILPAAEPLIEMTFIEGTEHFEFDGPTGKKSVTIAPFYVATREFTFGDFLKIRPGLAGNVRGRPATLEPPNLTMPSRYDEAEQWAEASGCRLLSDLEFAYLANLAHQAQLKHEVERDAADTFDAAGGSAFDQIDLTPPVRGILTGYAEWTSTWPNSTRATVNLAHQVDLPEHPELYRIIRGGTTENDSRDYPRAPDSADTSSIYRFHPRVGFRLARTHSGTVQQKEHD